MSRGTTFLVTSYGHIHRVSKKELALQLFKIANGDGYDLSKTRYVGNIHMNLDSVSPEEAAEEYKKLVQPIRTKHETSQGGETS